MTTRPELSFDGYGINGPDEYSSRIATFLPGHGYGEQYGPLFAAAPDLLAACQRAYTLLQHLGDDWIAGALATQIHAAIASAQGQEAPCSRP